MNIKEIKEKAEKFVKSRTDNGMSSNPITSFISGVNWHKSNNKDKSNTINASAKWIRENVGDNVAVDYLNFMNNYYE